jgi:hypothetical protein
MSSTALFLAQDVWWDRKDNIILKVFGNMRSSFHTASFIFLQMSMAGVAPNMSILNERLLIIVVVFCRPFSLATQNLFPFSN